MTSTDPTDPTAPRDADETRTTTVHHHEGHGWTGTIEVPTDLIGEEREQWEAAMGYLASSECAILRGGCVYLADETGRYYRVTDDEVLDLGRRELADEPDAYSDWCSSVTADEYETLAD